MQKKNQNHWRRLKNNGPTSDNRKNTKKNKARPRIPNKGNLAQMQSAVQGFINDPGYRQLPEPIKKALKELLEAIINEL